MEVQEDKSYFSPLAVFTVVCEYVDLVMKISYKKQSIICTHFLDQAYNFKISMKNKEYGN